MKCGGVAFLSFVFAVASSSAAYAQTSNPQPVNPRAASAQQEGSQIDIGGSFYRTFTGSTIGNGTTQTPSNSDGGLFELRYLASRYVGAGLAVSVNPANQTFAPNGAYPACGSACAYPVTTLKATAFEVVPECVPSVQFGRARLFAVGGLGFLLSQPGPAPMTRTPASGPPMFLAAVRIFS